MRALMPQTRGGLPRAELAAETGICKPAAGQSARRLAEAGLMADTGQRTAEGSPTGPRPVPYSGGAASRCFFRLVQIRSSWRMPSLVITGPSSRKAPLGWTCPDQRMRVPAGAGSNLSA